MVVPLGQPAVKLPLAVACPLAACFFAAGRSADTADTQRPFGLLLCSRLASVTAEPGYAPPPWPIAHRRHDGHGGHHWLHHVFSLFAGSYQRVSGC